MKTEAARTATPQEAHRQTQQDGAFLLDVRGYGEFAAGHAAGASCVPLPDLERRVGDVPTSRPVLVMCQSGGRSALAAERLRALGMDNITDIEGGFSAWQQAGLPSEQQSGVIPLERQVRIAAGALVLSFSLLGFFVRKVFFAGALFVGFMLTLTGAIGICPMMSALKLLPWNRTRG